MGLYQKIKKRLDKHAIPYYAKAAGRHLKRAILPGMVTLGVTGSALINDGDRPEKALYNPSPIELVCDKMPEKCNVGSLDDILSDGRNSCMDNRDIDEFPYGFMWGTANSALQVEDPDPEHPHDWMGLVGKDGTVLNKAVAHQDHRTEDAKLFGQMGNSYRFTPDWARLQHCEGCDLDPKLVDEYRQFIDDLRENGINNVMLGMHHFANPQWFMDREGSNGKKGWLADDADQVVLDYFTKLQAALGDKADLIGTFNEPWVYAVNGYWQKVWPPHGDSFFDARKVMKEMGQTHESFYEYMKKNGSKVPVGFTEAYQHLYGLDALGSMSAWGGEQMQESALKNFKNADWIGVQYYGGIPFKGLTPLLGWDHPEALEALGVPHDKMFVRNPEALTDTLVKLDKQYGVPLIITENGSCTDDDMQRQQYIIQHVKAVYDAIQKGADVKGYFGWAGLDNHELALGRTWEFGLVDVDEQNKRRMKGSGKMLGDIAKRNGLSERVQVYSSD